MEYFGIGAHMREKGVSKHETKQTFFSNFIGSCDDYCNDCLHIGQNG